MEGAGGIIFTESFSLGDPTVSTLEIWGAEYQESNALLAYPQHLSVIKNLASRERCPLDVVGTITGNDKVSDNLFFLPICVIGGGSSTLVRSISKTPFVSYFFKNLFAVCICIALNLFH